MSLPDREQELLAMLTDTFAASPIEVIDGRPVRVRTVTQQNAEAPLCRYPAHRQHDYFDADGRLVCGTCHPDPRRKAA